MFKEKTKHDLFYITLVPMKPNQIGRFYLLFITTCLNLSNALNRYIFENRKNHAKFHSILFTLSFATVCHFLFRAVYKYNIFSVSKKITAMILISVFFFFLFPAQQLCGGTQVPGSIRL